MIYEVSEPEGELVLDFPKALRWVTELLLAQLMDSVLGLENTLHDFAYSAAD